MSKAAAAAIMFATISCILGITLVYVLLPTAPNSACWTKTYPGTYNVMANETWDHFTTTVTLDRAATVAIEFYTQHASMPSESLNMSLRWNGVAYLRARVFYLDNVTDSTQFTSVPAGSYNITVTLEFENGSSTLDDTSLRVCVTYS